MRKILITGAAGFVGRHFTRRFLDAGDEVYAVDSIVAMTGGIDPDCRWPLFDPYDYKNFHFFKQDCRHFFLEHSDDDFDWCLHLAAIVGGRIMIEKNPLAVAEDLAIDSAYWQWAVKTRPKKTVCFSSSAAYPIEYQQRDNYQLLREEMIGFSARTGVPDMSYGWAKLTHEYLAQLAHETHGLNSVVYRPFSGYGEDQDDCYPFPSICKRAMGNKGAKRLEVWGTGDQMRDFIHVEDCVDGVLLTMDRIDGGGALNLSTGIYTSFREFARMAAETCGYHPEVVGMSDKPSGVFARGGDTKKQQSYGFRFKTTFREGIERAIAYFDQRNSKGNLNYSVMSTRM